MKTIIVAKVPGVAREIVVEDNATVGSVLDLYVAEYGDITGYAAQSGGVTLDRNVNVEDGTRICLVQQIKGNL